MKTSRKPLTAEQAGMLMALMAVMLGAFLYLYPPMLSGFPINDGGLFYSMIRALQQNGFRPPDTISYNGLEIPFAYPPLGFYVGGLTSTLLQVDPVVILRWLPAVVLVATSIIFWFLARRLLDSPIAAGYAVFLYVFAPRSMTWLVMGGGLTRGFGQAALLLTVLCVHALYTTRQRKFVLWSIASSSFVVLTHPEAALHALAACVLLWAFLGRNRLATRDSILVALGTLLVTSIWWAPVVLRHGIRPFISAGVTGAEFSVSLISPLLMIFTEEPMMTVIPVLGLIGFAGHVARKQYLLPAWFVMAFLVEPRSAATVAMIPCSLLAASALHDLILPAIAGAEPWPAPHDWPGPLRHAAVRGMLGFLGIYMLVMAVAAGIDLARVRVTAEDRSAFAWIERNTPSSSRFLVLTGGAEMFCSPVQEWFPVLTGRISESTIQGQEWTSNGRFYEPLAGLQQIQLCLYEGQPRSCIEKQTSRLGMDYNYVYITKLATLTGHCRSSGVRHVGDTLVSELQQDGDFVTVYQTEAVQILADRR
jgi:hypothetical protein